jgi:hypothetical protein
MVTSHDCHFDKEWNRRRRLLIKDGIDDAEAGVIASSDDTLDRTFTASPLVSPEDVDVDRANLLAGNVVGYLPVPASRDRIVPAAVVDLTYRVTLDRLDIVRVASISVVARGQLRYTMARLESLRTVQLGFEIEKVVGRQIKRVTVPKSNPLLVRLELDDGATLDLLQQPTEPLPGVARDG